MDQLIDPVTRQVREGAIHPERWEDASSAF
jgi:hypothetical protein